MAEGTEERATGVTIELCPNCRLIVRPGDGIRWMCDDWHTEVLAWLERQKKRVDFCEQEEDDGGSEPLDSADQNSGCKA